MTGTVAPWLAAHHLWTFRAVAHRPSPAPGSPRLAPHERVLVRDTSDDGTSCVATDHAIYWRTEDPACQWSRAGWAQVEQVGWERATHTLTLVLSPTSLVLHFAGRPRLPEFAAERVGAAHLLRRRVRLSDSCAATVAAVRDPDTGAVSWTVCFDSSCDTGDPALTRATDETVHELRRQSGC